MMFIIFIFNFIDLFLLLYDFSQPLSLPFYLAPDRLRMSRYEPRDRSGPMDIDNHDPIDRLSQFALHDPEQGPSRKRELNY